jgi:hypothetical protein
VTPNVPDTVIFVVLIAASVEVPVTTIFPAIEASVPTKSFLAIAAPPAVVNVPPFVALTASVVFERPIPPASVTAPVVLDVETVVLEEMRVETVDAPDTFKVPVIEVFPELTVLNVLVPVTERVPEAVILDAFMVANVLVPETLNVPMIP